jgi:SAM-dependent methyltransferase
MISVTDNIRLQAEQHPLEFSGEFTSLEEYCLHLAHLRAYQEAALLGINKSVLDLGCNNGYGTALLNSRCANVIGIDVSPMAIQDAQQRFGNYGINFLVYDGRTIPFGDRSFDMIVSFQVIEHIADTTSYLAEIVRVLRPAGMALFTTPNAAIRLDPGMKPWNHFHVREYLADQLSLQLRLVFAEVSIRGLFAVKDLYRIEFERCQGALRGARKRNSWRPATMKYVRDKGVSVMKILLPAHTIDYMRARRTLTATRKASEGTLRADIMNKYSTRDFFYKPDSLNDALDLMAICKIM